MSLAVTASKFNKLPSELAGILDPSIAFAFDVECAWILFQADLERESKYYEAMATGLVGSSLSGNAIEPQENKVERW